MAIIKFQFCVLCFVGLASLACVSAEILSYSHHVVQPGHPEYLKFPKFAKKDVPNWAPGNGRSFIDVSKLEMQTICDSNNEACNEGATFEALMFMETPELGWMDYWPEQEFCCSEVAFDKGLCRAAQLNRLIIPKDLPGALVTSFRLEKGQSVHFHEQSELTHHTILESGVYIMIMANCNHNGIAVDINGSIESIDPYGYLPADLFGNLPFFMLLTVCYTALAFYWGWKCQQHLDQIIPLQYWITGLVVMGMIESTCMYEHYESWNTIGEVSMSMLTTGLSFGVLKRTLSRITILLISLGYGIVKPSIGSNMQRVMQLGMAYFILSFCFVLIDLFPAKQGAAASSTMDLDYSTIIIFLLACIDTVFYVWIIQSINALMATLASRQQGTKYLLYRNFRNILFLSLFCTFVWGLYSGLVFFDDRGSNGSDQNWQSRWTVNALWELIYFIIMSAMAQMWAPAENSQRYAYSVELQQLDEDMEYAGAGRDDDELDNDFDHDNETFVQLKKI